MGDFCFDKIREHISLMHIKITRFHTHDFFMSNLKDISIKNPLLEIIVNPMDFIIKNSCIPVK